MKKFNKACLLIPTLVTPLITGLASSCSINYKYPNYTLACMGDSITYGYLPMGDRMVLPYPKALQAKLGFGHSYNYGVGFSTIAYGDGAYMPMVERIYQMSDKIDILIFWGGTNDFIHHNELGNYESTSSNTVYGALNNICSFISNKYSDSFVMFITPLPTTVKQVTFSMKDVRDAIIYTCNKYSFPVLDLYTTSGFEYEMVQSYSDGIHPTQSFIINSVVPKIYDFIVEHV